jgi:hypothetical protein
MYTSVAPDVRTFIFYLLVNWLPPPPLPALSHVLFVWMWRKLYWCYCRKLWHTAFSTSLSLRTSLLHYFYNCIYLPPHLSISLPRCPFTSLPLPLHLYLSTSKSLILYSSTSLPPYLYTSLPLYLSTPLLLYFSSSPPLCLSALYLSTPSASLPLYLATPVPLYLFTCSVSRWRPQKVDKRMVLEYTHGLFIT